MDKPMTFNEWLGTQGNLALVHANCCRIAYEAGQQSQQAKVEELQKKLQMALDVIQCGKEVRAVVIHERDELQKRVDALEKAEFTLARIRSIVSKNLLESILIKEVRQALKGEG
ncbi:hypothetical protein ACT43E_08145 [Acinetobacter baumannii]